MTEIKKIFQNNNRIIRETNMRQFFYVALNPEYEKIFSIDQDYPYLVKLTFRPIGRRNYYNSIYTKVKSYALLCI